MASVFVEVICAETLRLITFEVGISFSGGTSCWLASALRIASSFPRAFRVSGLSEPQIGLSPPGKACRFRAFGALITGLTPLYLSGKRIEVSSFVLHDAQRLSAHGSRLGSAWRLAISSGDPLGVTVVGCPTPSILTGEQDI